MCTIFVVLLYETFSSFDPYFQVVFCLYIYFCIDKVIAGQQIFETDDLPTTFVVCNKCKFRSNCYIHRFNAVDNDNVWVGILCWGYQALHVAFSDSMYPANKTIEVHGRLYFNFGWFLLFHV